MKKIGVIAGNIREFNEFAIEKRDHAEKTFIIDRKSSAIVDNVQYIYIQ